jgi:HK97 family phage major capsid protein
MAILRQNAEGIIPVEQSKEIVQGVVKGSSIMSLSRLEEMTSSKKTISVLEGVAAYFAGEGSKIPVNEGVQFRPVNLETKKLSVIIPFSNELLDESIVDVVEELKTQIVEQFYRKFDDEAVNGTDSIFELSLNGVVTETGNSISVSGTTETSLLQDISDTMALVEDKGYDVNGFLAHHSFKTKARMLKDDNGNALYTPSVGTPDMFYGQPINYSFGVNKNTTELVLGDWQYSVVGVQGQIKYKLLTEATVGTYNLAEQDMSALRVILPVAYAITKKDAFAMLKA